MNAHVTIAKVFWQTAPDHDVYDEPQAWHKARADQTILALDENGLTIIPRAQYEALMALHKAAETYYRGYVQDEADEEGVCGRAQQLAAIELRDSLAVLRSAGIEPSEEKA